MSTGQFAHIALAVITPSLTNPRKHFNPAKLTELATSIAASGVHQPVLLRPLPGARVADTDRKVEYELVCGERRYRASLEAKVPTIPAMIRALTDDQVMEIQIVENLQRDDLSELEEAEGFQALMQHAGLNAEQVGAKIGKSRAHVYARLKLLDLGSDGRTALREGKIEASVALLLARIPDSKLQTKALKEVMAGAYDYDTRKQVPMSHRAALSLVQNNYMLKLANAIFDIKSVDLVPAAGACEACPKRTGHAPELFQDVPSADVCTDPTCFHKKEEAHSAAQVAEAEAKGLTVIAGKEAQELRGNSFQDKLKGYRRLDNAEDSPTDQPLRKIIGAQMKADGIKPVLIEDPRKKGELLECLPNETVLKLIKIVEGQAAAAGQASAGEKAPKVSAGVQKLVDDKKAKAEAKAKAQFEREWRANLVADTWVEIRDDADVKPFEEKAHRFLAMRAARNLSTDDAAAICQLLDLGKVSPVSAVTDYARDCVEPDMLHLLIIMQEASGPHNATYHDGGHYVENEGLMLIAGNVFGKKLEQVINEIKGEVKDKIWPKVAKAAKIATVPAAPPKEGAGGNGGKGAAAKKPPARAAKLSAEEATQGIAAAMQGIEAGASAKAVAPQTGQTVGGVPFAEQTAANRQLVGIGLALGQRVRIDAGKLKGKEGDVVKDLGSDCYSVKVKGRSVPTSVSVGQLTVLEGTVA
jgi:ParB/RepB/Spo0J family partition protein